MNTLADRFGKQGVGSIFLYTHEAHPGENYPHLRSMEQKAAHARALRDVFGEARPIFLDALDGACHRAYGSMPNMTWIFNRTGRPVYKAAWTDAHSVENALEYLSEIAARRREGVRLVPVQVERMDYRTSDQEGFYRGLERNGPKAVQEFHDAFS